MKTCFNLIDYSPRCQISVHKIQRFQIFHSRGYLSSYIQQAIKTKSFDSESQCPRSLCRNVISQKLIQVTVFEVFDDDAKRFLVATHSQNSSYVGVFQCRQDFYIPMEVQPRKDNNLFTYLIRTRNDSYFISGFLVFLVHSPGLPFLKAA